MDQNAYWQQHNNHQQYQQHYGNNANQYDHHRNATTGYYDPNIVHYANQAAAPQHGNAAYSQNSQDAIASGDWENNWGWGEEDNANTHAPLHPKDSSAASSANRIEDNFVNDETWNWSVDDNAKTSSSAQFPEQPTASTNQDYHHQQHHHLQSSSRNENSKSNVSLSSSIYANSGIPFNAETKQWSHEFVDNVAGSPNRNYKAESAAQAANDDFSAVSTKNFGDAAVKQEVPREEGAHFVGQDALENKEILSNIKQDHSAITSYPPSQPAQKYGAPIGPGGFAPISISPDDTKTPFKQQLSMYQASPAPVTPQDYPKPPAASYQLYSQPVNLETPPENSERPDQVPPTSARATVKKPVPVRAVAAAASASSSQQWQENNEVPINDRNQYLETGRLSAVDVADALQDPNDTLPPPGLRRMVLGQMEQHETDPSNSRSDEQPPPGLSRMVLGQRESNQDDANQSSDDLQQTFNAIEPPEGLHRMIPGESSSPESTSRHQQQYQGDNRQDNDDDSDYRYGQMLSQPGEPRSATLGADTPPIAPQPVASGNRSDTIGGSNTPVNTAKNDLARLRTQIPNENRIGAVGLDSSSSSSRSKDAGGGGKHDKPPKEENFRDPIEGETQETIASIVTSIRNLTVGENINDDPGSSDRDRDSKTKHSSRQESSDSDPELRSHRDDRYRKRGDKHRKEDRDDGYERDCELPREERHDPELYTPEYRDKKHGGKRRYRDRRYEEDTDYYSDRDRDRRGRERDATARNYGSLHRDKERRRREPRDLRDPRERDYDRDYRRNYYYNRYENESLNESQSRASSRSDSVHNAYRDRGYDGQRFRGEQHRQHDKKDQRRYRGEAFNAYAAPGYPYDPYSQYYQQYQYYEALRRSNPQAYAEFYRKYYQQNAGQVGAYDAEDRASVHSGRSSANEGAVKERFAQNFDYAESSVNLDDSNMTANRLTPLKFPTAHVKASIASGRLVRVSPQYLLDGQSSTVEICNIESVFLNDEECRELIQFPGPLSRGATHKKPIIEYCENKIKVAAYNNVADAESYVLLWELLILLIRQNGMVVGADIAELLLKNRNSEPFQRPLSVSSSISSSALDVNTTSEGGGNHQQSDAAGGSTMSVLKESEITGKFREHLLYGSVKEALEWAMKNSLWGHALFLASKLDKRTYASVITRFANGLALNDPLQTLYQLLSGRTPAVVTCISDDKWGDWRPHLAMILSNTTQYPELNCKAVTTLGDTLSNKGCIYAAQFCYLMAEVGFGSYGDPSAKLVLLGGDHSKPFDQFVTNEAIHMTEVYEYACSLNNPDFSIPNFQYYKYVAATRLSDCCMLEKSLMYLEKVAGYIVQNAAGVDAKFANNVYTLADRLKYYDLFTDGEEGLDDGVAPNRPDGTWLKELREIFSAPSEIQQEQNVAAALVTEQYENGGGYDTMSSQPLQEQQQQWQPPAYSEYQDGLAPQQYITSEQVAPSESHYADQSHLLEQPNSLPSAAYANQQPMWQPQNQWQQQQQLQGQYQDDLVNHQQQQQQQPSYFQSEINQAEEHQQQQQQMPKPQISMPNQSRSKATMAYDESDGKPSSSGPPAKPKQHEQKAAPSSTGWFGGIFSRLAPKPKNQMKLPDDTNPTIVWDAAKKRWVNNDDDSVAGHGDFKPPPKMSDLAPKMPQMAPNMGLPKMSDLAPKMPQMASNMGLGMPEMAPNRLPDPLPRMRTPQAAYNHQGEFASLPNLHGDQGRAAPTRKVSNGSQDSDGKPPADPNMFRMHGRSRNLKKSYVDVFNPGKKTGAPAPTAMLHAEPAAMMGGHQQHQQQPSFFVPPPVSDPNAPADFLTPSVPPYSDSPPQGD